MRMKRIVSFLVLATAASVVAAQGGITPNYALGGPGVNLDGLGFVVTVRCEPRAYDGVTFTAARYPVVEEWQLVPSVEVEEGNRLSPAEVLYEKHFDSDNRSRWERRRHEVIYHPPSIRFDPLVLSERIVDQRVPTWEFVEADEGVFWLAGRHAREVFYRRLVSSDKVVVNNQVLEYAPGGVRAALADACRRLGG